jgi:NTE family protein
VNAPNVDLYAIDASFSALDDPAEVEYLINLPRHSSCPRRQSIACAALPEPLSVRRPNFKRLLKDAGAELVTQPAVAKEPVTTL